jgi:fatty-acid desaturase
MMLLAAYLAPNFILWHAGSSINSINHMFGTKDCETDDNSKNNIVTASLVWGEGWHNSHHADSSRSLLHPFDISGLLISLIGRFRKEN